MEESLLIARVQHGDRGAFAQLVERYQTPVYNLAYRMLNNANDAEDAAQETFLRAYAQLKTFRVDQKIGFWKFGVNECLTNERMCALDSFIRFIR